MSDTCDQTLEHLDAYLDGTLGPATVAAVEAHLAQCAECSSILDDARFLRPLVAALPEQITPPTDLWPGVRNAIRTRTRRPRWALAAAVVLAIGGAVASAPHISGTALRSRQEPSSSSLPTEVARFEHQVGAASAELEAAVRAREHQLDPGTVATIERNLAIIDAAIDETRVALEESPDDARIADAFVSAHHQKIRLLRQVLWAPGRDE